MIDKIRPGAGNGIRREQSRVRTGVSDRPEPESWENAAPPEPEARHAKRERQAEQEQGHAKTGRLPRNRTRQGLVAQNHRGAKHSEAEPRLLADERQSKKQAAEKKVRLAPR